MSQPNPLATLIRSLGKTGSAAIGAVATTQPQAGARRGKGCTPCEARRQVIAAKIAASKGR